MARKSVRSKPPKGKQTCSSCGKSKNLGDFYASSSPLFSSTGRVPICKDCIKNNSYTNGDIDLDKLHAILRQIDKPLCLDAWSSAEEEVQRSLDEGKGRTDRIGTYFRMIQSLKQYKNLTFADSSDYNTKHPINKYAQAKVSKHEPKSNTEIYQTSEEPELIHSKKWMGNYTKEDIEYLDNYYVSLERDYKISTENHRDYARKISKASLQMDKCFEDMMAGVSGADTRYKNARETFDGLCKSAKFSENTRSMNDVGLSSFSIICDRVEKHNWIPEHTPLQKDDVDQLIDYLSTITKSL